MSYVFKEFDLTKRKPDFEYEGKIEKYVRFIADQKRTCLVTSDKSVNKNMTLYHVYLDGVRVKGFRLYKGDKSRSVVGEIINGIADQYGLLSLGEHEVSRYGTKVS